MLPFSKDSAEDSGICVLGFGMQYLGAPLHTVYLESDLVTGPVMVGVLIKPEVTAVLMVTECLDGLAQKYPEVFSPCAVTRAMSKHQALSEDDIDFSCY